MPAPGSPWATFAGKAASAAYQAGGEKPPFIDGALIERSRAVTLTMNPPAKTGERCIVSEHRWEDFFAGGWDTFLEDEGIYLTPKTRKHQETRSILTGILRSTLVGAAGRVMSSRLSLAEVLFG